MDVLHQDNIIQEKNALINQITINQQWNFRDLFPYPYGIINDQQGLIDGYQ